MNAMITVFACLAGAATMLGLAYEPWRPGFIGLAVTSGLFTMIEALAMVRIHIDQVMRHRLEQQEYKRTAHHGIDPKTGSWQTLTSAEYDDLIRKSQEPPL